MIVIKVEMWPGGVEANAYPLGTAVIANDGSGSNAVGNYKAEFGLRTKGGWRSADLRGFPRTRLNVWFLIARLLRSAGVS